MNADSEPILVELVACPAPPPRPSGALGEMVFRPDAWTPADVRLLRQMFADDRTIGEIASALGRRRAGVADRIYGLGLRRHSRRPWSEFEDTELIRRYGHDASAQIASDFGRSCQAIYARAALLELTEGNAPAWTAWEDAQLRAGFAKGMPTGQIATIVGRPHSGLVCRASKLGLRHPCHAPDWSAAEIERALALVEAGHCYAEVGRMLAAEGHTPRSKAGLQAIMRKIGAGKGWGRLWTDEEDALLTKAYRSGASLTPLRLALSRSRYSIRWRASYLGLTGSHDKRNGWRGGPDWTEADLAQLRADYGKVPTAALAKAMGRSKASIFTRANVLGLAHGYHRPWSRDECAALERAFHLGIAMADLAAALGRKPAAVHKYAANHGFRFGRRTRSVLPMTLEDILGRSGSAGEEGEKLGEGAKSAPDQETHDDPSPASECSRER
ncbi:hypothetical protein [uncultured Novosphingobium sp.]|uniref:hypothetical protein n=1 Tax=uncultured Novosphingobium sp. TaxID=292277 RepID=UPI00259788E2|nr:hypothetical protein [uncultured Novosphingobium sp.]